MDFRSVRESMEAGTARLRVDRERRLACQPKLGLGNDSPPSLAARATAGNLRVDHERRLVVGRPIRPSTRVSRALAQGTIRCAARNAACHERAAERGESNGGGAGIRTRRTPSASITYGKTRRIDSVDPIKRPETGTKQVQQFSPARSIRRPGSTQSSTVF